MNLVHHVARIVLPCNGALFCQIHHRNIIVFCRCANIGIVLLPCCLIHRIQILRKQCHGENLRIGISLLHLVQENAVGFAEGYGSNIGSITVNQFSIFDCTIAYLVTVKIIVVNTQIYKNHIGVNGSITRIVGYGVIVKVYAPFQIGGRNLPSIAGLIAKNLRTGPRVVHQQFHATAVGKMHPPSIVDTFQKTIAARFGISSSCVVSGAVSADGGVYCGIVGVTVESRNAVAQNGNILSVQNCKNIYSSADGAGVSVIVMSCGRNFLTRTQRSVAIFTDFSCCISLFRTGWCLRRNCLGTVGSEIFAYLGQSQPVAVTRSPPRNTDHVHAFGNSEITFLYISSVYNVCGQTLYDGSVKKIGDTDTVD